MGSFVRIDELQSQLDELASRTDVLKMVDSKVEEDDFKQEILRLNEKVDRMARDIQALSSSAASQLDLSAVREKLDRKVDSEALRESLKNKVEYQELEAELSKKVGIEELEELLETKAGVGDFEKIIEVIDKKADSYVVDQIEDIIASKADSKDVELLAVALNKKADRKTCEETRDESALIKKEIESLFEEIDQNFKNYTVYFEKLKGDIETCSKEILKRPNKQELADLKTALGKKLDGHVLAEELGKFKDDVQRSIKATSTDIDRVASSHHQFKKSFEDGRIVHEKKLENDRKAVADTVKILKNEMDRLLADKGKEQDELVRYIKGLHDNVKGELGVDQESILAELKDLKKRVEFLNRDKLSVEEARSNFSEHAKIIKMKADLDEVQSSLNAFHADSAAKMIDLKDELLNALKNQNLALMEQLNKKPNAIDMKKQLVTKVDNDSIEQILDNYLKTIEFDGLVEQLRQLHEQAEVRALAPAESDSLLPLLKEEVGELRKQLIEKASIQEVYSVLDKKCSRRQ